MNQAAAITNTPTARQEVERAIRGRFGAFPESSIQRMVDEELREFERDLSRFNRAEWLQAGLNELAYDGRTLNPTMKKARFSVDDLIEAVEAEYEEAEKERLAALAAGETCDWPSEAIITCTRAWLGQSEYALWKRVQHLENRILDEARDYIFEFATNDGPDLNKVGQEAWNELVWNWFEDYGKQTDRVLEGR